MTNFFNIYIDPLKDSNQLAGTGYGNGTLILSAIGVTNDTNFAVKINQQGVPGFAPLDGFGIDNYLGIGTVVGQGGGQLEAAVTGQNNAYFVSDFSKFFVDLFFNTSNIVPFKQATRQRWSLVMRQSLARRPLAMRSVRMVWQMESTVPLVVPTATSCSRPMRTSRSRFRSPRRWHLPVWRSPGWVSRVAVGNSNGLT